MNATWSFCLRQRWVGRAAQAVLLLVAMTGMPSFSLAQNGGQLDPVSVGIVRLSLEVIHDAAPAEADYLQIEQSSNRIDITLSQQLGSNGTVEFPLCIYGDAGQSFSVDTASLNEGERFLIGEAGEAIPFVISLSSANTGNGETWISAVGPDQCTAETALNVQLSLPDTYQPAGNPVLSGFFQILLKAE